MTQQVMQLNTDKNGATVTPSTTASDILIFNGNGNSSLGLPKPNQVSTVLLYGVPIVSLYIEQQERLCLAQISNTLLKSFSYNEIHNRRVALGITCVQCTPVQLEILRRAGAMPVSSRRCGMITRREAERLCKSFLGDNAPPRLPEDFAFSVMHECAWGCRGSFMPSRYNSSRAKCIKCQYCGLYYSPNKFIFHSHRMSPNDKYVQPDAANFNSWRRHMKLLGVPSDEVIHAWEDVKAMFNGGTRKRLLTSSSSLSNSTTSINSSMAKSGMPDTNCMSTNRNQSRGTTRNAKRFKDSNAGQLVLPQNQSIPTLNPSDVQRNHENGLKETNSLESPGTGKNAVLAAVAAHYQHTFYPNPNHHPGLLPPTIVPPQSQLSLSINSSGVEGGHIIRRQSPLPPYTSRALMMDYMWQTANPVSPHPTQTFPSLPHQPNNMSGLRNLEKDRISPTTPFHSAIHQFAVAAVAAAAAAGSSSSANTMTEPIPTQASTNRIPPYYSFANGNESLTTNSAFRPVINHQRLIAAAAAAAASYHRHHHLADDKLLPLKNRQITPNGPSRNPPSDNSDDESEVNIKFSQMKNSVRLHDLNYVEHEKRSDSTENETINVDDSIENNGYEEEVVDVEGLDDENSLGENKIEVRPPRNMCNNNNFNGTELINCCDEKLSMKYKKLCDNRKKIIESSHHNEKSFNTGNHINQVSPIRTGNSKYESTDNSPTSELNKPTDKNPTEIIVNVDDNENEYHNLLSSGGQKQPTPVSVSASLIKHIHQKSMHHADYTDDGMQSHRCSY